MRVTPEQYRTFFNIVVILILCFFAFVGFRIMLMKQRWKEPPPRRKAQSPGAAPGTGESAGTFGTSGIGASDMSTSMDSVSSSDSGSSSFDSGGDTGGSGASGGWND